jgi:NAD(P)-dependent dehydrogenase (short-subunit alcohol dehydrogenase family)
MILTIKQGKTLYLTSVKKRFMKTVIITGAGGHLGSAVTKTFLDKGYRVIVTVSDDSKKKELSRHDRLELHVVNLMHEEETLGFVQKIIATHGTVDAGLLLVGGFAMGNMAKTSIGDVHAQIALNFSTAYHVARPLFTHMLEKGSGRLVFIGSRPALEASAGKNMIAYGLSKSLLFKLADYMNAEAKGKNVVTAVVAPSTLDTEINRKAMPNANPDDWVKTTALAEILEFLVSDQSAPMRETVLKVYNNA